MGRDTRTRASLAELEQTCYPSSSSPESPPTDLNMRPTRSEYKNQSSHYENFLMNSVPSASHVSSAATISREGARKSNLPEPRSCLCGGAATASATQSRTCVSASLCDKSLHPHAGAVPTGGCKTLCVEWGARSSSWAPTCDAGSTLLPGPSSLFVVRRGNDDTCRYLVHRCKLSSCAPTLCSLRWPYAVLTFDRRTDCL